MCGVILARNVCVCVCVCVCVSVCVLVLGIFGMLGPFVHLFRTLVAVFVGIA